MVTGRSWVRPMFVGFVVTFAGQTLVNLFMEGISGRPIVPIPGPWLILAGSLATGFGSAWFSRSSPGLLRGPLPATARETFFFEALFTAVMVMLTNMCGWVVVEAIRVAVNSDETDKDRLLSIPLALLLAGVCAAVLLQISAFTRHQAGTPFSLVEGVKTMIRSIPWWKRIAKPREQWKPTKAAVRGMYALLYTGLAFRVAAGVAIGWTFSAVLSAPGETTFADFWSSGGFIVSVICAGIGMSIAGLPEKLLPKRDVSRGRQVLEEIVNAVVSGLVLIVAPVLIVTNGFDPLWLLFGGFFYVAPMVALWAMNTLTRRSIEAWAKPVSEAKGAKKMAKRKVKELKRTHAKLLRSSDDESDEKRHFADEEVAAAEAEEKAANEALAAAREGKK